MRCPPQEGGGITADMTVDLWSLLQFLDLWVLAWSVHGHALTFGSHRAVRSRPSIDPCIDFQ